MHPSRLFIASCFALIATAMSFAIRGDIMTELGGLFGLDNAQVGLIAGTAFWGFTVAMIVGGPLCDLLGMKRLVWIAVVGHAIGVGLTVMANGFWMLFAGTLSIGIANGMVEASCNPLVASLFPNDKTAKLNQFHVWFPGGIVIGGLVAFAFSWLGLGWQMKMLAMLVPVVIYAVLFARETFPVTERVSSGVGTGEMFGAVCRPLFLIMVAAMFLTAATELGTNQWLPELLTSSAGVQSILVLVWINGLMALGRQFAGPVVHHFSPPGVLLGSAVFSAIGLFLLSRANGAVMTFTAATVFAVGVCYFWPTMLGFVSERCPKTGALGLAIMGGAGMLSVAFVLPIIGSVYDKNIAELGKASGGATTLGFMTLLPLALALLFLMLLIADLRRGGYKPTGIQSES